MCSSLVWEPAEESGPRLNIKAVLPRYGDSHRLIFNMENPIMVRWHLYIEMASSGSVYIFNSSPPGQNGRHFADDMFKCIFLNENIWISNKISLKYVPWGLIDSMSALVQIMVWRRPGDKPLSEPMLTQFTDTEPHMQHWGRWVKQSGTKPNLVAKILATKFGGRFCRLPKLVAKISSKFQHLVNTGLDVGSGIKWLPLKVVNTCKLDIIWVFYCSKILNGSIPL